MKPGIPLIAQVDDLLKTDLYRQHIDFNQSFLKTHGQALAGYGKHWGEDPFLLWSRRWEYPFTAAHIIEFAAGQSQTRILDAGSGVTYLPYFLCDRLPQATVTCCDSDKTYIPMFEAINRNSPHQRVNFVEAMLQRLPFKDGSYDVICCVSVLEHTRNYGEIINEFARVLRPGGALVLTFDLSLDNKFELSRQQAEDLLHGLLERFTAPDQDPLNELARMKDREHILSTDYIRRTSPHLLPWKYPILKGVHDLLKGHGWTGGFRSKSVFCLSAIKK
jgi:SAM-dependent methyltransferase